MGERGSEKLMRAWQQGPFIPDQDLVAGLAKAIADLEVFGVLTRGTPRPDFVQAEVTFDDGDPELCGNTVRKLLELLGHHGAVGSVIKVFPRGIPQLVDGYRIVVEVGQGEFLSQ